MSQLPAPVVALVVAFTMRTTALPALGAVNLSSSVVKMGAACVPVTRTVYVFPAVNAGEKPVRLVVLAAARTASCGFAALTFVHELAEPNAMLLLPVPTVPFCAMSRIRLLVVALKKRTVVLLSSVPVGLLSSLLQAERAAAVPSASMAAVMRRECTIPPDYKKDSPGMATPGATSARASSRRADRRVSQVAVHRDADSRNAGRRAASARVIGERARYTCL